MENCISDIFDQVSDPRVHGRCLHKLSDILFIAFCSLLSNGEDFMDMVEFGKQREDWLNTVLELPNGIPSHDTFNRVFQIIDPEQLKVCLSKDGVELLAHVKGQLISLDGKKLRGVSPKTKGSNGLFILNAWISESCLCIGQQRVDGKSNEITAIPKILDAINIEDQVISIDAMGFQTEVASRIVDQGGDYILAVKLNQGGLHEEMEETFDHIPIDQQSTEYEKDHGRVESRTCSIVSAHTSLSPDMLERWTNLNTLIKIEAIRIIGGVTTSSVRYYITSLQSKAARYFNKSIREHWSIENKLHWHLDVTFSEDQSRARLGNAAENLSILRKMALQKISQMTDKLSKKKRRFRASLNNLYLIDIILN